MTNIKFNMTPQKHGLGWVPDLPDHRDYIFVPKLALKITKFPDRVDLRAKLPPVYDQGQLGSCTANALGAAFDFDRHKQGHNFMTPSRLFIYWNERDMENSVESDAGARIRDGVKVLQKLGTPPEKEWPYIISKFRDKPSPKCYEDALRNQALTYSRILTPAGNQTNDMLACLAGGYPFVSGIAVYESFESPVSNQTGVIHLPTKKESLLGGHAILIVGYDQIKGQFIFRNYWGNGWGDKGYGYMPFDYLTNRGLASDMWVIRTVEV
jgi:C1A family cysteine protease